MSPRQKLNLERFKKSTQGLIEFAKLIEQAAPAMQQSIIERATEEDPEFVKTAMRKVVFFEELCFMDEGIMAEILTDIQPKVLAYALHGTEESFRKSLLEQVGFRALKQIQDEEDRMGDSVAQGLVLGAQKHILKVARNLEEKGKFMFEALDAPRLKNSPKKRKKKKKVA